MLVLSQYFAITGYILRSTPLTLITQKIFNFIKKNYRLKLLTAKSLPVFGGDTQHPGSRGSDTSRIVDCVPISMNN